MNDTELTIALALKLGAEWTITRTRLGYPERVLCLGREPYRDSWDVVNDFDIPRIMEAPFFPEHGTLVPNYCGNLNACHKIETKLDDAKHDAFQQHLLDLVAPGTHWSDMAVTRIVSATARQRAEALYLTLK